LIEMSRLSVVSRVKQAYYRLARVYAASDVIERNVALLDTLLQVSEGRYAVGQAAQQDVIKAQTELSILELQQRRLAQERSALEAELNALRNRPASTPVGRPEDLELVAFDHPLDALLATARDQAPMLQRDRLMIERAEAGVALAKKESRPDFTVSGGYAYSGVMPPMFEVRVDVNVPLRKERRTAAVAEQTAQVGASRADYDANRLTLETSLQQQYRASATALELARLYRETVLPQARLALESSLASYESGSVDFLSVLTNFGAVLEYEMNYFEELMNFHVATSQVEAMTGAPLVH
jgi:outer membrane protein TolC